MKEHDAPIKYLFDAPENNLYRHIQGDLILNNNHLDWNGLHFEQYKYGRAIKENYRPSTSHHQMVYFLTGALKGHYSYGGSKVLPYSAEAGSWYFGQAFENNSFWNWEALSIEQIRSINIYIEPTALNKVADQIFQSSIYTIELPHLTNIVDPLLGHLAMALKEDLTAGCPAGSVYGETIAQTLYVHMIKKYCKLKEEKYFQPIETGSPIAIKKAIEYIHSNIGNNISLEMLSDISCTSMYHFIRIFKNITGKTPYQYIIDTKLREAARMLAHTNKSVGVISEECGFSTENSFYRAFKRKFGTTPKGYRLNS